jgi:MoxR-like ATPase
VNAVVYPVLRHRIILSFDAISDGISADKVISQIVEEKGKTLYA